MIGTEDIYEQSTHLASEKLVQDLLSFVHEHEVALADIQVKIRDAIADAPDCHYRAVRVGLESKERVLPSEIIHTDSVEMRKILTILLFNCACISHHLI